MGHKSDLKNILCFSLFVSNSPRPIFFGACRSEGQIRSLSAADGCFSVEVLGRMIRVFICWYASCKSPMWSPEILCDAEFGNVRFDMHHDLRTNLGATECSFVDSDFPVFTSKGYL